MEMPDAVKMRVAAPLDVALLIGGDAVGRAADVQFASSAARMLLPVERSLSDGRRVLDAPPGFERLSGANESLLREGWGRSIGGGPSGAWTAAVDALAFEIDLPARDLEVDTHSLRESTLSSRMLKAELADWMDRFLRWCALFFNQPLDRMRPAPAILNPPHNDLLCWAEVGEVRSKIGPLDNTIVVHVAQESVASERAADVATLDRVIALTNDQASSAPLAIALTADARLEYQRGDMRRAITELGTATEAVLFDHLGYPPRKTITLGRLAKNAIKQGVPLPADTKDALVRPRNDAVHRGRAPTQPEVLRAIEIVQGLLQLQYPTYLPDPSLKRVRRPMRADLRIIQ